MNYSDILNGNNTSYQGKGFARSVMLNQLSFDLQRAAFASQDRSAAPVFDAELVEAMGDNGLPQAVKLDVQELTNATAAAFLLLSRHIQTPDPETGRKPEYLMRFLKGPKEIIQAAVDYRLNRQKQQTQATAQMLGANPETRLKNIEIETKAQAEALVTPMQKHFVDALRSQRENDDDTLIDTIVDAMTNAGRDPAKEIKRAAVALIESQKKRFEAGGFVAIDPAVYVLAQ
ncbi:MAG: hypothetical protein ACYC9R_06335 [Nitrosotalea sp.]